MSGRGSTAKISSLSSMSPPLPASRVCTLTFILAFLALVAGLFRSSRASLRVRALAGVRRSACILFGRDRRDLLVARKRRNFVDRGIVNQAWRRKLGLVDLSLGVDQPRRIRRA